MVPDKGIDATGHWSSERIEAVMKKLTDRKHLINPFMRASSSLSPASPANQSDCDPSLTHIWPQPQPAQHKCLLCSNAELLIC